MHIHPTAIVSANAKLGANVTIGPFSVIEPMTQIGDNTIIGPHVVIHPYTTIGAQCTLHAHAVLGDLPQDLAFAGTTVSYLRIGNHCVIREGVTMHRGTKPESATVVGENCFLMANSHVAHNVQLGDSVIMANGALLAGYVEVGDRAFISGNVVVHQFCRIGKMAMISGNSSISKDIPPFCMTHGGSANAIAGLNIIGLRRADIAPSDRMELRRAFRTIFRDGLNITQALAVLNAHPMSGAVRQFYDFIAESKRGICAFEGVKNEQENSDE